jgi:hypothetical protein
MNLFSRGQTNLPNSFKIYRNIFLFASKTWNTIEIFRSLNYFHWFIFLRVIYQSILKSFFLIINFFPRKRAKINRVTDSIFVALGSQKLCIARPYSRAESCYTFRFLAVDSRIYTHSIFTSKYWLFIIIIRIIKHCVHVRRSHFIWGVIVCYHL